MNVLSINKLLEVGQAKQELLDFAESRTRAAKPIFLSAHANEYFSHDLVRSLRILSYLSL